MSNAKAKTINLLLYDGTLKGVISMADTSWNSGELYSAPRESVDDLIKTDACSRYGVYLLISEDMVYVGQASDLSRRIKQHKVGKSWWEQVIVLTTSDDSLNKSDIDYLEASLIAKAGLVGRLDSDNRNKGNKKKVDKFREVFLEQYLEEALVLLELIGVNVFKAESKRKKEKDNLFQPIPKPSSDQIIIREKKEALQFVKDNGITLGGNVSYAKRQEKKSEFWLNPRIEMLEKEWEIVLNNQFTSEIIVLRIPAKTFQMKTHDKTGFFSRHDKPELIDMNIIDSRFVDRRSKYDLSSYIVRRIKY